LIYPLPPSLFDALAGGKPLPQRDNSHKLTLSRGATLTLTPEGTVHPFAVSLVLRGSDRGRILTLTSEGRKAWIGVNRDHKVYYRSSMGDSLVCQIPLEESARHTITLSHRYASKHTLFFVDTECVETDEQLRLSRITVGDASNRNVRRQLSELFFWRSALNSDEVMALARGKMLRSSLEVYTPLDEAQRDSLPNLAQALNRLRYVPYTKPKR